MTQELQVMMNLMSFGNSIVNEGHWETSRFKRNFEDYLLPNMDEWELAVVAYCAMDLTEHVMKNGEMPESVEVNSKEDVGPKVMDRYMQIAWSYVSHEFFGEDTPLRYATPI